MYIEVFKIFSIAVAGAGAGAAAVVAEWYAALSPSFVLHVCVCARALVHLSLTIVAKLLICITLIYDREW